jgi:hypothetical protein
MKQVEVWKESVFEIVEIKSREEFYKELDAWRLDDGLVDHEWIEAGVRTKEQYGEDFECWKSDKWIRELAMTDVEFDAAKKQKKLTKAERRERNQRDELKVTYELDDYCSRQANVAEEVKKKVKWKKEDQQSKDQWEG